MKPLIYNTILICFLTMFAIGCGPEKVRESAVRLQAINNLKQIQMAVKMYAADHGTQPDSLKILAECGFLTNNELLFAYVMTSTASGTIIYSKTLFKAVQKGEPWGGQGEVAAKNIPAGRAVLIFDIDPSILHESEFQKMLTSHSVLKAGELITDLSLTIQCQQPSVKVGDEIEITFDIKNEGNTTYQYNDRNYDRSGRMFEYKLSVVDQLGMKVQDPRANSKIESRGGLCGGNTITPGESFQKTIALNRWALLKKPGTYMVTGIYSPEEEGELAFVSPPITVRILPREGDEMTNYIKKLEKQLKKAEDYEAKDAAIKKLMYTCDKRIAPILIQEMHKTNAPTFWINEALSFYLPDDPRWKQAFLNAKKKKAENLETNVTILNERGASVENVWVWGDSSKAALTDKNGKAKICTYHIPSKIYAYKKGYLIKVDNISVTDNKKKTLTLQLLPAKTKKGRIVDDAGTPVPNVKLPPDFLIKEIASEFETSTDENGEFSIRALPEKETIRYTIKKKGFDELVCELSRAKLEKPIVIKRQLRVAGKGTDIATGKPVNEIKLFVNYNASPASFSNLRPVDYKEGCRKLKDGVFDVYTNYYGEAGEKIGVTVFSPGYRVWKKYLILPPKKLSIDLNIRLKKLKYIRILVNNPDKTSAAKLVALLPKSEFYLNYRDQNTSLDFFPCLLKTESKKAGEINIPLAPENSVLILLNEQGWFISEIYKVRKGDIIQLNPWLSVKGNWKREKSFSDYDDIRFNMTKNIGELTLDLRSTAQIKRNGDFYVKYMLPGKYYFDGGDRNVSEISCAGLVNMSQANQPLRINGVAVDSQKKTVKFKIKIKDNPNIDFQKLYNSSEKLQFYFDDIAANFLETTVNKNNVSLTGFLNRETYDVKLDLQLGEHLLYKGIEITHDSPNIIDLGTIEIQKSKLP